MINKKMLYNRNGFTYVNSDTDRMQHNVKESDEIYSFAGRNQQDNADKDNETTSETVDDNKDDSNSEPDIRVYGTEDNTDYSIDGMLAIAKDINSDMNNKRC